MFLQSCVNARRQALVAVSLLGVVSFVVTASLTTDPDEHFEHAGPVEARPALTEPVQSASPPPELGLKPTPPAAPAATAVVAPRPGDHHPTLRPRRAAPTIASAADYPPLSAVTSRIDQIEVSAGDTLLGMLTGLGVKAADARAAVAGLSDLYDPRHLRPGQRLEIETEAAAQSLVRLQFEPDPRQSIEVVRAGDGAFDVRLTERPTIQESAFVEARVATTLHAAASSQGLPHRTFAELVKLFSWDVDFQRETRPGDRFAVLFDQERLATGAIVGAGQIDYARLEINGRTLEAFYFDWGGNADYFDRGGHSLRKFLLRTPLSSAQVSSGYGMRRHPILGYNRMHRGVDFRAPTGTPIYAAGSGRLARVGRLGGYGNYIRIEHGNGYATAYAHLSRFANGIRAGRRVRQGDVIGYVGSTGRSTGPHLHFEVLQNGKHVNPMTVAQPPASKLEGDAMAAFERAVRALEGEVAQARQRSVTADAGTTPAANDG